MVPNIFLEKNAHFFEGGNILECPKSLGGCRCTSFSAIYQPKLQVLNDGAFVVMGHLDEEKVSRHSNVQCIYLQLPR